MAKFTYVGSLLIAVTLIVGSFYFPQSFIMSFVSSSAAMIAARTILAALMIGLIVTNPPRSKAFRTMLGAASAGLFMLAVGDIFSGTIQIADSILFLHAALSFAIASLETRQVRYVDFAAVVAEQRKAKTYKTPHLA
jgi:hypothetical protein